MRKIVRALVLVLLCGMLVILCGGLALSMYYRNNFPVNTWLNGVYCTGKTIEEVNTELVAQTVLPDVCVFDKDGEKWVLKAEDIDLRLDYTVALKDYLRENSGLFWMNNLQAPARGNLRDVNYNWNQEKLQEAFGRLDFVAEEVQRPKGCQVEFTEEKGYFFYEGNRERLNTDTAIKYVEQCLSSGKTEINLLQNDCYENPTDTSEDRAQRQLWEQLNSFFENCKLTYDMGAEKIPMSPAILSTFLKTNDSGLPILGGKGQVVLDEELVKQWVDRLAEDYNTCDTICEFQSTRGDIVSVQYSTYGTELDAEAEKKYLVAALQQRRTEEEIHTPTYKQVGFARGLNDIGHTYIEVDMTEQHMYYYMDGELVLDTDVVTGHTGRRMGTPEGINFVYSKQRNRVLRGQGYASPVKYWMPVKGGVGIHDADWRTKFGGEIYKKDGSHGCINTPPEIMSELYDMVEVGTPVVMFY